MPKPDNRLAHQPASADREADKAIPQWFIDGLKTVSEANQGMFWNAADYGTRKYDPDTGTPYISRGRPEMLTVYSERAAFLYRLIREANDVLAALASTGDAIGGGE